MKACILLQGNNAKIAHALACQLRDRYDVNEWCGYVISHRAKEFLDSQRDLQYTSLFVDHMSQLGFEDVKLDKDKIDQLERAYGGGTFWVTMYSDRRLMMSTKGMDQKTMVINPLYSHDDLMRVLYKKYRAIEKFLDTEKPDVIIFFAMGLLGHSLLYYLAKERGIQVLINFEARIGTKMAASEDYRFITGLKEAYDQIAQTDESPHRQEARDIISTIREQNGLNLGHMTVYKKRKITVMDRLRVYRNIVDRYIKDRNVPFDAAASPLYFLSHKLKQKARALRGYQDIFTEPIPGEKYVFFPLHYEPEVSLTMLAPFFMDQAAVIRHIAKSLPMKYKLYVKEHPIMANNRTREYYKSLLAIPNVRLIDPAISSINLIEKAALVTVISGTVGWEAVMMKKPVLTMGDVFFNDFPLVKHCTDMTTLPQTIRNHIDTFEHDEQMLVDFIAGMIQNGVVDFAYDSFESQTYGDAMKRDVGLNKMVDLFWRKMCEGKSDT